MNSAFAGMWEYVEPFIEASRSLRKGIHVQNEKVLRFFRLGKPRCLGRIRTCRVLVACGKSYIYPYMTSIFPNGRFIFEGRPGDVLPESPRPFCKPGEQISESPCTCPVVDVFLISS